MAILVETPHLRIESKNLKRVSNEIFSRSINRSLSLDLNDSILFSFFPANKYLYYILKESSYQASNSY